MLATFFYTSKKHNVSPIAKKIILEFPSKKTLSQKMIKNTNLPLKYARNAPKFLDFFLAPKGNCADGLCHLKLPFWESLRVGILPRCVETRLIILFESVGETLHFRWYKKALLVFCRKGPGLTGISNGIQSKQSRLFIEPGLAKRYAVLIKLEGK